MEMIENPVVVDWWWKFLEKEDTDFGEKSNGPGYTQMKTGVFVPEEDAFEYAISHCITGAPRELGKIEWTQEFKDMLVEWFYSGNWIRSDGYGTD